MSQVKSVPGVCMRRLDREFALKKFAHIQFKFTFITILELIDLVVVVEFFTVRSPSK